MAKERDEAKAQRREASKLQRAEAVRRREKQARLRRIGTTTVVILAVGALGFLVINNAKKSSRATGDLTRLAAAAGCSALQTPADRGSKHEKPYSYDTNPPTSGNHAPGPAPTGVSAQPVPDENQTHNLEHGNVAIQYKDPGDTFIDGLRDVVRDNPTRIVLAPRPTLDARLALTAWGRVMKCAEPTAQVVELARAFVAAFAGKGPEGDVPGQPQGV